jgi:hypothetical protein
MHLDPLAKRCSQSVGFEDPVSLSLKRKRATHFPRWIYPQAVHFNDELDPNDFPSWGFNPDVPITFAS